MKAAPDGVEIHFGILIVDNQMHHEWAAPAGVVFLIGRH